MTEAKLRKRIFSINLGSARHKIRNRKVIIISDSKGQYLVNEQSTETFLDFQIVTQPGLCIDNPNTEEFIWSTLRKLLGRQEKAIVYLWLGTCDFTIKSRKDRLIRLKYNTENYRPRIDNILDKVQNLERRIEVRYKKVKTILLECPPFSIVRHNKFLGHHNCTIFKKQTEEVNFFQLIFCSPGQRPCELLPSRFVRHPSVVSFSHFNLLLRNH